MSEAKTPGSSNLQGPSGPDNRGREEWEQELEGKGSDEDFHDVLEPGNDSWDPEVREILDGAEEELGRDIKKNFEGGGTARLPGSAVGATVPAIEVNDYGIEKQSYMLLDRDLDRLTRDEQIETVNHENVHAELNNGELYGNLIDEGMPSETVGQLAYMIEYGSEEEKEGATEFISLWRNQKSDRVAGSFYPFLTAEVSRELERAGNHPDYNLKREIEEGAREAFQELVLDYYTRMGVDDDPLFQAGETEPVPSYNVAVYEFEAGDEGYELTGIHLNGETVYDRDQGIYQPGIDGSVDSYEQGENGFDSPIIENQPEPIGGPEYRESAP